MTILTTHTGAVVVRESPIPASAVAMKYCAPLNVVALTTRTVRFVSSNCPCFCVKTPNILRVLLLPGIRRVLASRYAAVAFSDVDKREDFV